MKYFALIIVFHGTGITTLPNYTSEETCRAAASTTITIQEYARLMDRPFVFCIPIDFKQ